MTKLYKRILFAVAVVGIWTATTSRAVGAPSVKTIDVSLIDTNVPLYVLLNVPEVDTRPLGMAIIIR